MALDPLFASLLISGAACGAAVYQRWKTRKKTGHDTARSVEAERIVSLLSNKQPGVWDQEELRERVARTARELWSLPTREALASLQTWVSPALLEQVRKAWPARGDRREVSVQITTPVSFIQVNEGGPGPDRLIARLHAGVDATWYDDRGKRVKQERRANHPSYHTWIHIDGQGWQLEAIADAPPVGEPPPSSVSCRILPEHANEETERYS